MSELRAAVSVDQGSARTIRPARRRRLGGGAVRRAVIETCERRVMLTAALRAQIPTTIGPGSAPQQLLAPGVNNNFSVVTASTTTASSKSYRFAVNNAGPNQTTTFTTTATGTTADAAIALYDASGNRLYLQDADAGGLDAVETLSAVLTSGQQYTVSFYAEKLSSATSQSVSLGINTGSQALSDSVNINPATSTGSLTTSAPVDAFNSSSSVRYFPVNFTNAGQSATLSITPAGPDTSVTATFYGNVGGTWFVLSSNTLTAPATSASFSVSPLSSNDLNNSQFLLAVEPLNFTASPEPVTINVATTAPLAPATINPSAAAGGISATLSAVGTVTGTYGGSIAGGVSQLVSFIAPFTGTVTVTDQPTTYYAPILSAYGPGGTQQLAVASQTTPQSSATVSFNVVAGSSYYLLSGANNGSTTGSFTLTATQTYTPTVVAVTSAVQSQASIPLGPYNGSAAFQLAAPGGSNFVALYLAPDAGQSLQTQIKVIAPNQSVQTFTASGLGQAVTAVFDESTFPGPYDVVVSGIAGTGATATFKYAALTTPASLSVGQFPSVPLNLASGGLTSGPTAVTTGVPTGIQYYQPIEANFTINSTYTVTTASGAAAVLVHYVQTGNTLQPAERQVSNGAGVATLTTRPAQPTINALVALPVNFSGTGTVQIAVTGPAPIGTPVQLSYNISAGQPAPTGAQATASAGGQLATTGQRDLYAVIVPYDLNSSSASLVVTPTDGGGTLALTVQVLTSADVVVTTATNTPGQPVTIPLTGLTAGQTIRFLVQPVAGTNLGTGLYSLAATFSTGDTSSHFVTEQTFYPYTSSQSGGNVYLPNVTPTNITFGTTGGSATGQFNNSSSPAASDGHGAVQLFTITGFMTGGPFQVTTTDTDPGVNTDIALYYAVLDSNNNVTQYTRLPGTAPSFDYNPSDRSAVDSRIVINNTDLDPVYFPTAEFSPQSATILAVVMNEHGSLGRFTITAAPVPAATAGPGTGTNANDLLVSAQSGNQYLTNQQLTTQTTTSVGYSLRTPAAMATTGFTVFTVKTKDGSSGQSVNISISRNGIIFVASLSGTIPSGGTLTLSTTALGRLSTYAVTVALSSVPSQGVTIGVAVPPPSGGTVPTYASTTGAPPDGGYGSAYFSYFSRLNPAPNGSFSAAPFTGSDGLITQVFNIQTEGTFTYHVAYGGATGVAVGLYEAGQKYVAGTGYVSTGVLLDYTNAVDGNGLYSLTDYLSPGTYFITGQAASGAFGNKTVTGSIPALNAKVLGVEPANGITSVAEESILNQGAQPSIPATGTNDATFNSYRYASAAYAFTVPTNTNGSPVSVTISDNDANAGGSPVGLGTATVTLWKLVGGIYTQVPVTGSGFTGINDSASPATDVYTLTANEPAVAGTQYFATVDLDGFSTAVYVGVTTPVVSTGRPDYSVGPIVLTADYGKTLVSTTVTNTSGTVAPATTYTLQLGNTTATRSLPALAPYGSVPIQAIWTPQAPTDVAALNVNPGGVVAELSTTNNAASTPLSSVDPNAPTGVTIALSDPLMTAEGTAAASAGGTTWGRYISGVTGQAATITFVGTDPDGDLLDVTAVGPNKTNSTPLFNLLSYDTNGATTQTTSVPVDFANLAGTSASNPNQITFYAIDKFGLRTYTHVQTLDVTQPPSFLTGGVPANGSTGAGGTIKFNASNHQFTYNFTDSIISVAETISQLLGIDVPVVGNKNNVFFVNIAGTGTGGLAPTAVSMQLTGETKLVVLDDDTIFDKSYSTYNASSTLSFRAFMTLDGHTLAPGSVSINLALTNLSLLNYNSPSIPLGSYGVPGVASIDAGIKFGVSANLSAGATLGLALANSSTGGALAGQFGIMSPTFIQPQIMGTATVTGSVDVLGLDVADLSGSIGLTLKITLGLDNSDPGAVYPFSQAVQNLGLTVDAKLTVGLSASIWGFNVWSYNYNHDFGNIVNTLHHGIFLTDPPSTASGKFIAPPGPSLLTPAPGDPTANITSGSTVIGAYTIDPSPQLVIDPSTGSALSVQVANLGTTAAPVGNLTVSTRNGGSWSAATNLSSPSNDVSYPVLSLTHDAGAQVGGVVVYQYDDTPGSPATQTVNQRLDSFDLHYRYFNGSTWTADQTLTNDALLDAEQSVAFNATGNGVLAYVHNTDPVPINSSGVLDAAANDIRASIWNGATHTWGAVLSITSGDGVQDGKPTTFVDSTGKAYVVWVRTTGSASQLYYSVYTGSTWSAAAPLQTTGLTAGGVFRSLVLGADGAGRVNVVFSYQTINADGTYSTALYQRPATTATFGNSLPAVQIAANSNFSGLKTTPVTVSGTNGMLVYWQQSDGQVNQIAETSIANGIASPVTIVTNDPNVASHPTAAVDTNGKLQVLYDNSVLYGQTSQGSITDTPVGAPLVSGVASSSVSMLPQLSFSQGLSFPVESQAGATTGSTLTGSAVLTNRGLSTATVTVTAYDGLPGGTVVGTQSFNLSPGATFAVSQAFPILAGNQTYSFQAVSPQGQAFNTSENVTSTTLLGGPDLVSTYLDNDVSSPAPGSTQTLYAGIQNNNNAATGPFTVTLYAGDPLSPGLPLTVVGTQTVNSLAANAATSVLFTVTLPNTAGDFVYTAVVDSGGVITESNENNNESNYEIVFRADPAITANPLDGTPAVTATLVNGSTGAVQVVVNVANNGAIDLTNVPVDLTVSRDGGVPVSLGQVILATLPAGTSTTATFNITALGGDDVFTATIDPSQNGFDTDLSNNSGTADLIVPGLPTLSATVSLSAGVVSAGFPVTLTANLSNTGLADANNVPLLVLASLTSGGPSVVVGSATANVSGLGTTSVPIALNTAGLALGTYTLTLQIDPDQTITQGTNAGNSVTTTLTIGVAVTLTGNNEYLRLDGTNVDVWNNTSPTGAFTQYALATLGSLTAAATTGGMNVTVDYSLGNPLPQTGLTYTGPAGGNNVLNVIGSAGNDSVTVNAGSVSFLGTQFLSTINYTGATTITFNGGAGADTLTQTAQPGGGAVLSFVQSTSSDTLSVTGGVFTFPAAAGITPVTLGALSIAGGSVVVPASANHANRSVLVLNTVSITGGTLDLTTNDMLIHSSGLGVVQSLLAAGSIFSSTAATSPSHVNAVAVIASGNLFNAGNPFDGQTPVATDVLVKFTYYGDTNLDGKIDGSDYSRMDNGFLNHLSGWFNGDFNYDGTVDGSDYSLIDNGFNRQSTALPAALFVNTADVVASLPIKPRKNLFGDATIHSVESDIFTAPN